MFSKTPTSLASTIRTSMLLALLTGLLVLAGRWVGGPGGWWWPWGWRR